MSRKILISMFLGVVLFFTAYAIAQVYMLDTNKGTMQSLVYGKVTWIHVGYTTYQDDGFGNYIPSTMHSIIRADKILGIRGPVNHSTGMKDPDGNSIMETICVMHTIYSQYPSIYLPDISDGTNWEQNLDWAIAIERVVTENPGGIVELSLYLP